MQILRTYYTGRASIMGLLSSSLLVMPRFLREAWLIRGAAKQQTAVSMYTAVPKAYNKIDDDFTVHGKRSTPLPPVARGSSQARRDALIAEEDGRTSTATASRRVSFTER